MIVEILKKISEFQNKFDGVIKQRNNDFTKSKFANLEDVFSAAYPVMQLVGLDVAFFPEIKEGGLQILRTVLFDIDGNFIESQMNIDNMCTKQDAQRVGSAITYARRYSLCSMLNILTYDDDGTRATKPDDECTQEQIIEIEGLIQSTGTDREKVVAHVKSSGWGDSINAISFKQASKIIGMLKGKQ